MIVVAVVVAIAAAVLGHSSRKSPAQAADHARATSTTTTTPTGPPATTTTSPAPITGPAAIAALFAGIPQHGDTLGNPSAPVTMVVFEDPQCPFCDEWSLDTLPTVLDQFVRTGKVKLVYRGILIIGPNSVAGLRAIVAAGRQNKLWNMNEALYANQGKENSGWITSTSSSRSRPISGSTARSSSRTPTRRPSTNALEAAADGGDEGQGRRARRRSRSSTRRRVPKQLHESSLEPAGFVAASRPRSADGLR